MISRRKFIRSTGLVIAGFAATNYVAGSVLSFNSSFISKRPLPDKRKFVSKTLEAKITEVKKAIGDPELAWLFENCFPNTLDTTVQHSIIDGKPDTFVITGDINAMWLRDSSAQVWPYLPLAKGDKALQAMISGVINRQVKCIHLDPYANAFLGRADDISEWKSDITEMKPGIHERKWEIDSLCYPIRLSYGYWKATGDTSPFDAEWQSAMELIYNTFVIQQRKENRGPYSFKRITDWQTDTVPGNGYGNPIRPVGLICSMFRPSDDATVFPFLVPSNFFAVTSLSQLGEICDALNLVKLGNSCRMLSGEVKYALLKYATLKHPKYGEIYAYEIDGYGNQLMMDDSNVPSLLSLPYLGCVESNNPTYLNTRNFLLSDDNPWFFRGTAASGIGSPHTLRDKIWPMTIIMQAMTSSEPGEIKSCLVMLKNTHAGTGFMHESFNKDNPSDYTRSWFAWANTLFGELILKTYHEYPRLLAEI